MPYSVKKSTKDCNKVDRQIERARVRIENDNKKVEALQGSANLKQEYRFKQEFESRDSVNDFKAEQKVML